MRVWFRLTRLAKNNYFTDKLKYMDDFTSNILDLFMDMEGILFSYFQQMSIYDSIISFLTLGGVPSLVWMPRYSRDFLDSSRVYS